MSQDDVDPSPSPEPAQNIKAGIQRTMREVVLALRTFGAPNKWAPDKLERLHTKLKREESALPSVQQLFSRLEITDFDWTNFSGWGRLLGFGKNSGKYLAKNYNGIHSPQLDHILRMQMILHELEIIKIADEKRNLLSLEDGLTFLESALSAILERNRAKAATLADVPFHLPTLPSRDPSLFNRVMGEGLLIRLKGAIHITPKFFAFIYEKCSDPRFAAETISPDHLSKWGAERLTSLMLARIAVPAVRTRRWDDPHELTDVVNEASFHVESILYAKAQEVGILMSKGDRVYALSSEVIQAFGYIWTSRLTYNASKKTIHRQAYEAWKEIASGAVASAPGEDERYAEILALFMFAVSYDRGDLQIFELLQRK